MVGAVGEASEGVSGVQQSLLGQAAQVPFEKGTEGETALSGGWRGGGMREVGVVRQAMPGLSARG